MLKDFNPAELHSSLFSSCVQNKFLNLNVLFQDLVSQLGHYSPKVRRDALTGMTELFAAHPEELTKHVVIVIEAIGGKASDVDGAVRAALLKLLSVEILPKLNGRVLEPFIPLLMAHICRCVAASVLLYLDGAAF